MAEGDASQSHWTQGPAKWAALGALALLILGSLLWSFASRSSGAVVLRQAGSDAPSLQVSPVSQPADAGLPPLADQPGQMIRFRYTPRPEPSPVASVSTPPSRTTDAESPAAPDPLTPAGAGSLININTATEAELRLLPRIGPTLAARIIEYRTANGPFRTIEDLTRVRGIGEKTFEGLRPLVTLD